MVAIEPSANIKRIENSFASSTLEASVPNLIQVLSCICFKQALLRQN